MVRSWTPDLVMMPSYGLGFFRPSLLGSVTAKVLNDTSCPVWTNIHSDEAPALERISCAKVLYGVDLGERSQHIFEWALSFAGESQADLALPMPRPWRKHLHRRQQREIESPRCWRQPVPVPRFLSMEENPPKRLPAPPRSFTPICSSSAVTAALATMVTCVTTLTRSSVNRHAR